MGGSTLRSISANCGLRGSYYLENTPYRRRRQLSSRQLARSCRGKLAPQPSGLIYPHYSRGRGNLPERVEGRLRGPAWLPYQAHMRGLSAARDFDGAFLLEHPGLLDAFQRGVRHDAPVYGIDQHCGARSAWLAKVHEEVRMLAI